MSKRKKHRIFDTPEIKKQFDFGMLTPDIKQKPLSRFGPQKLSSPSKNRFKKELVEDDLEDICCDDEHICN